MYIPRHNLIEDQDKLYRFMDHFSFATLITTQNGLPIATHLPFVIEAENVKLIAHMARANAQWKTFVPDQEVLVIFQGDHGYVSPSWYEVQPSVPTWNYMAVHAYGTPHILEDDQAAWLAVQKLIDKHESAYQPDWGVNSLPADYLKRQIKAFVAFEIQITRLEGKFKLSQNRTPADQAHVIDHLSHSDYSGDHALAESMCIELQK